MKYTRYNVILDPATHETRIYLMNEDDDGMDDYLELGPADADRLSGTLIMTNAQRKRETAKASGGRVIDRLRRR